MTRVPSLASWCAALAILIAGISVVSAQDIKGSIRHASQAIVIDGNPDEAAWATANEYTLDHAAVGDMPDDGDDLSTTWKALWDDDNLYVYLVVTDDYFSNDGPDAWQDDSFELYIDAEARGKGDDPAVVDYNADKEHPVYQLTIIPGEVEISNGVNHERWVTNNGDSADLNASADTSDTGYKIEWAIPWSTLTEEGENPADILDRGFFGFGLAVNDDDEADGERQTQLSWADALPEQWHLAADFPDVELLFPEGPGPDIFVKAALDLGTVSVGEAVQFDLEVGNVGQENALTISGISVTGPDQDLVTVRELASVAPGEVGLLAVTLDTAGRTGAFDFTIEIQSDDVDVEDQTKTTRINASVINFDGPAAYYAMDDEAGGTELRDVTGYNRHGTLDGATLGGEGLASGGSLNVSSGSQAVVPGESLGEITDFTVSMWIQPSELAALQTVIAQGAGPTFAILIQNGDLNWFSGEQTAEFGVPGAISAGTTYHVAASYTADQAVLYLDGVAVATQDSPVEVSIDPLESYFIGAFEGGLPFSGLIDDVQIYDRVLSADDVAKLFRPVDASGIAWGDVDLDTTVADLIGGPSITFAPFAYDGGNAEGTFWTGDGGTTGDDVLDLVYNSHGWNGAGASIVLDGLTDGQDYQVQLLGAGDTRGCCNTRNQAADDGNGNVSGDFPRGNSSVIGTFTASGDSQEIMIVGGTDNGVDPGLSGFIVTDASGGFLYAFNVGREGVEAIVLPIVVDRTDLGATAISSGPLTEPALVDFGDLSDDATYEFSFKAIKDGGSTAIAGNASWGLKLDQWNEQGVFGTTEFGVADNLFTEVGDASVASIFDEDVHVVIINDSTAGESHLYLNGVLTGTAGNFELAGEVSVMAAQPTFIDKMGAGSVMYGWATYNTALSAGDVAGLAGSPFPPGREPLPPLMSVGIDADGAFGLTLPAGVTADVEYSTDLIMWETIANGISGAYSDPDATRAGNPAGFYRAKQ